MEERYRLIGRLKERLECLEVGVFERLGHFLTVKKRGFLDVVF